MKATLDCLECMAKQALKAARIATDDLEVQRRILNEVAAQIPGMDTKHSPAELSMVVYETAAKLSGKPDPYWALKREQNRLALAMESELEALVAASEDRLTTALHLSAAGNIIDLGTMQEQHIDVRAAIRQVMQESFAVDHSEQFRESLGRCRDLLFLLDNAGEIVFDKVLIQELQKHTRVTAAVKGSPILNDATREDAGEVGLTGVCEVIDTGCGYIGAPLGEVAPAFAQRMRQADMIVAKGQGNYETVDDFPGDVFLILRAKCEVVARHMGVLYGQVGLISTRVRQRASAAVAASPTLPR